MNAAAADADPLALDLEALIAQEVQSAPAPKEPPAPTQEPVDESLQDLKRVGAGGGFEDFFGVLNISWDDSDEIYRSAYFKLAGIFTLIAGRPRAQSIRSLAEQIFAKVTEAWEVLGEEETRKAYVDRTIHGIKSEDELAMEQVQAILAAEDGLHYGPQSFPRGSSQGGAPNL